MNKGQTNADFRSLVDEVSAKLDVGKPIRSALPCGGRVHIDRPLPFLCLHEIGDGRRQLAAEEIATAHAAYLLCHGVSSNGALIEAIADRMEQKFGGFVLLEIAELAEDALLEKDSPYLPPFQICLSAAGPEGSLAASAIAEAIGAVEARYRTPEIAASDDAEERRDLVFGERAEEAKPTWLKLAFAPIYRQPQSDDVFPDLLERVVANLFDCALRGLHAFARNSTSLNASSHRALGRRLFVKAVQRVDEKFDEICRSFDFLMAVTPINTQAAWAAFHDSGFDNTPRFLYRPLAVDVDREKRRLFGISFEQLEDPVLVKLYHEKQAELDTQLTMLRCRDTIKFREASRMVYGSVRAELADVATSILNETSSLRRRDDHDETVDCSSLKAAAQDMLDKYRATFSGFDAVIEIRDDLPAGLMVSGSHLLISRQTRMSKDRIEALLSHEIGVHLLTYFSGEAQGLRLFRSGLAGYEGVQEGLAVFAEYAAGGMTLDRLRLIAARVLACQAMLADAGFIDVFRLLTRDLGFADHLAFNITVRVFRSGGFAKDAIYLRGLLEVLHHLRDGGRLDPFWIGKIATSHLTIVDELRARGLLKAPPVRPLFLSEQGPEQRIERARAGLTPTDLIAA